MRDPVLMASHDGGVGVSALMAQDSVSTSQDGMGCCEQVMVVWDGCASLCSPESWCGGPPGPGLGTW